MRRRITVAVLALACMAAGAPMVASGKSVEAKYRALRAEVVQKHGERAPGRNIVRDGVRTKHGARPARLTDITQSIEVMRRMLAPPAPTPASSTSNGPATASSGLQSQASAPSSGGGACNAIPGYIVQRESGGNPAAVNPSSGAFGCYQLMPEHFAGGGACADLSRDQAGQDRCAARLWDGGRGSGNWAATR